jgi:dTDP-4-dehydrorhamnose 3,5-epimerase
MCPHSPRLFELFYQEDCRGFFVERFPSSVVEACGGGFLQTNHSRSLPSVLRGLHTQKGTAKLLSVIQGEIFDVCWHPEAGAPLSFYLRASTPQALYIPEGWFHGFQVLGHLPAEVLYQVTRPYEPREEEGLFALDPSLGIPWPEKNPLLSERDAALPSLKFRGT